MTAPPTGSAVRAFLAWRTVIAVLVGATLTVAPRITLGAEPEIVANVNGEPVTRAEFRRMLANPLTSRQLEQEPSVKRVQPNALDRLAMKNLIQRRLMLQEARRRNITVEEKEVDQAITSLRRQFKDLKRFGAWMKEQGLDERSLFASVRADMVADRVRTALLEGSHVTDDQVYDYYRAHLQDFRTGEEVRLRIIAVKDRSTGEEIMAALQRGRNFATVARQRSIGMRAAQGGDAGWLDSHTLWEPLRSVVRELKPHQAAGPLEKGGEFLIVRLEERRPARTKTMAESRAQIERILLPVKQREVIQTWLAEQEAKSKIDVLLLPS